VKNVISILIIFYSGFLHAQDQVEGSFYLFSNMGPIRMDIKPSGLTTSFYDYTEGELNSVDYNIKEEYKNNGFYYICYNDVETSRAVLKLKHEESGNYGLYFIDNFNKESQAWNVKKLMTEIKRDTANVRIGRLHSEKNYKSYFELKDNLNITDEDYVAFFSNYIEEARNLVKSVHSNDKKALTEWFYHHPYIQMSIISDQLINLGYRPVTDTEGFVNNIIRNEHKQELINQSGIDSNIFE